MEYRRRRADTDREPDRLGDGDARPLSDPESQWRRHHTTPEQQHDSSAVKQQFDNLRTTTEQFDNLRTTTEQFNDLRTTTHQRESGRLSPQRRLHSGRNSGTISAPGGLRLQLLHHHAHRLHTFKSLRTCRINGVGDEARQFFLTQGFRQIFGEYRKFGTFAIGKFGPIRRRVCLN